MSTPHISFLQSIDHDFKWYREVYIELSYSYSVKPLSADNIEIQRKNTWPGNAHTGSPISRLYETIVDYYEKGTFEEEITYNLINNHMGYFEYAKNVFAKQHSFMILKFPNTIKQYFNDVEEGQATVEYLDYKTDELSNDEFYKAVQFQIIQFYKWIEEQFNWLYPLYKSLFSEYPTLQVLEKPREHIRLDYEERYHADILKTMHEALYGTYIQDDFESFSSHFQPFRPKKKIRWLSTQITLVLLFQGTELPSNGSLKHFNIATKNSVVKLICEHFADSNGKEWLREKIEKTKSKIPTTKEIRNASDIYALIMAINKMP